MPRARLTASLATLLVLSIAPAVLGQSVQVSPFGGYRFGGDLFEVYAGTRLYIDGAPCLGVTADIFVRDGTSVTFLYSRQQAQAEGRGSLGEPVRYGKLFVEHWHAGGTQEVDAGQVVRPYLSGSLGVTRFGGAGGSEARFSLAGGAGVRLMPSEHVGARLDGRVYAVFVDGGIAHTICGGYGCAFDLDVVILWQVEFSAGVVFSF